MRARTDGSFTHCSNYDATIYKGARDANDLCRRGRITSMIKFAGAWPSFPANGSVSRSGRSRSAESESFNSRLNADVCGVEKVTFAAIRVDLCSRLYNERTPATLGRY